MASALTLVYTAAGALIGFAAQRLGESADFETWQRYIGIGGGIIVFILALRVAVKVRAPLVCKMPILSRMSKKAETKGANPLEMMLAGFAFATGCMTGRRFRALAIVDDYSRECPAIEVDTSLGGARVVGVLERLEETRGLPEVITVDNGPEFASKAMDEWAYRRGIKLSFIRPGKPVENAFAESFNGRLRDECLNINWFMSVRHAREIIENWRQDYNEVRPHSSLKGKTPKEFAGSMAGLY